MSLFRARRSARPALHLLARPAGGRINKLKANRVMKDFIAEPETFNRIKREILSTVEAMRKANPEAAEYLEAHLVFDDQAMTFLYTGDDRLKMTRVPPEPSAG